MFIDKHKEAILKIKAADLHRLKDERNLLLPTHLLYSTASTTTASNLEDLTIEKEYLFWTNSATSDGSGAVHKAFTEPFGRAVPLQTFADYDILKAQSIATNSRNIFFTGYRADSSDMELFIQPKHSAEYYSSYSYAHTRHLKNPGAVLPYKDTLLLVANQGFIS